MIPKVFLDTSGWLAAVSTRDSRHKDVVGVFGDLMSRRVVLVTSNLVLAEMHVLVVRSRGAKAGCDLLDAIYSDPLYEVVTVDRDLESEAADRWLRKFDQSFSLTDAVSFEIMRRQKIREAVALDHHFAVAGYTMLPAPVNTSKRKRAR